MLKYYFLLRGQGHGIPALDVLNSTAKRTDAAEQPQRPRRPNWAMATATSVMAALGMGKVALQSTVVGLRDRGTDAR